MTVITIPTTATVDTDDLKTVLRLVGFPEDTLDVAQAIAQAESAQYEDAVGDVSLITAKYGPSIGLFQIRSLRSPQSYTGTDLYRYAYPLRNRFYNATAALAMSKQGTDWTPWSTWTNLAYKSFLGQSPKILTGHSNATNWWK